MANNEIRVIVTNEIVDSSGGTASGGTTATDIPQTGAETSTPRGTPLNNSVGRIIVQNTLKQATSFVFSNYGSLTGDYQTQANIQSGIEALGLIGIASTGPLGAAAALSTVAIKEASRQMDITKRNRDTDLLRQRTGMTNISGGRR